MVMIKMVELLLQDPRVEPSVRNNEAILLATCYGHVKMIELLFQDPRVDPSALNFNRYVNLSI